MNPQVKAKWVEALNSGEYKQGRNKLRVDDSFCCLGVLCDTFLKSSNTNLRVERLLNGEYEYNSCYSLPPKIVCNWAEMDNNNPMIVLDESDIAELKEKYNATVHDYYTLTYLNDIGVPFEMIAKFIDKYL